MFTNHSLFGSCEKSNGVFDRFEIWRPKCTIGTAVPSYHPKPVVSKQSQPQSEWNYLRLDVHRPLQISFNGSSRCLVLRLGEASGGLGSTEDAVRGSAVGDNRNPDLDCTAWAPTDECITRCIRVNTQVHVAAAKMHAQKLAFGGLERLIGHGGPVVYFSG